MAGGSGSRLRPLTCDLPKPMVPVMAKPVMTYSIELLKKYGIEDIGITLQYLPQVIEDYFQDGSAFGVKLHYFVEETPLGTAGSVKNAENFLDETFIVISGDALTDINITNAINFHKEKRALATLVLKRVEVPLEYGVVITDENGAVTRFLEKPNWSEVFSDTVNTGIYILEPEVLSYFKSGQKFDFSQDLFPLLLEKGKPMYGYITEEYWCDIGNLQTYLQAHYDMLSGKVRFPVPGHKIGENIWVGENVDIHPEAKVEGPCYIGDYTRIREGAYIGPFSVIGRYNDIGPHASIKRSVLWNYNTLSRCVEVRGAAVCNKVDIRERVSIYEGAVIGNGCTLKPRVKVKPDVKIWPEKVIEHGTTVQSNVIWGTRFTKTLFGKNGITGKLNVDLDPRFAVRLGAAVGAELKPGKRVAVSCDENNGSALLKHGIISGLLSSGVEVLDLGSLTTSVLRYMVPYLGLDGGIHVFEDKNMDGNAGIHFIDKNGGNFSPAFERQVENAFVREDFQRVAADKIPKVQSLFNVPLFYAKALTKSVNADVIRNYGFKVLLSTPSRLVASIAETVFSDVGCELHTAESGVPFELEKGQYSLACYVDGNGEELELYDEKGKRLSREMCQALRSFLCLKANEKKEVVVPYTAPTAVETMAQAFQGKVIRTKTSRYALMNEVIKREGNGGVFLLYADALAVLLKLLEVLAEEHKTLSELVSAIPRFYMKEKVIECPWGEKGKVMRWLIQEETKGGNVVELFEGVKVHHKNGWALVLPDSEEAVCRIYSEGVSEEYAEELTRFYEDKINWAKKQ